MTPDRIVRPHDRVDDAAGGFTIIELLIVVVIIGILAGIATPNYQRMLEKARAVEVLGDMNVVKIGAANYLADYAQWPVESAAGQIPSGMDPYLPTGFALVTDQYSLDWDNLTDSPNNRSGVGVGVTVDLSGSPNVATELYNLVGSRIACVSSVCTWIIEVGDGAPVAADVGGANGNSNAGNNGQGNANSNSGGNGQGNANANGRGNSNARGRGQGGINSSAAPVGPGNNRRRGGG